MTNSKIISFTKMHGLGNDFVVVNDFKQPELSLLTSDVIKKICHRRFGVGADQFLWIKKAHAPNADARMEVFNQDGSQAQMCGNGIRAVGLFLSQQNPQKKEWIIETLAGLITVWILDNNYVRVNMGVPVLGRGFEFLLNKKTSKNIISIDHKNDHNNVHKNDHNNVHKNDQKKLLFYEISMGNPHCVIFTKNIQKIPLTKWGPLIETHRKFPDGVNVEFVEVGARKKSLKTSISIRIWERGAGETLACGTGACASVVTALALKFVTPDLTSKIKVYLPGGELFIQWDGPGAPVFMEGPACFVFNGRINIDLA
ncbi:MAG: diaminopimelate epimerase [Bdellovibrio sp.]|nr:diaminopimelate epimerase [Bdellovibrio sp.]